MKKLSIILSVGATPALAAGDIPFFSLFNTNFVVWLAFLLFIGILVYLKVPGKLGGMLDQRAVAIKAEIDEARALREEAQTLLASFERKHKEVEGHVAGIVEHAKKEAELAGDAAKEDLKNTIARRIQAAEEQIKSAEQAAVKEVKDTAISVAIAAASDVIAKNMSAADAGKLVEKAIAEAGDKLH